MQVDFKVTHRCECINKQVNVAIVQPMCIADGEEPPQEEIENLNHPPVDLPRGGETIRPSKHGFRIAAKYLHQFQCDQSFSYFHYMWETEVIPNASTNVPDLNTPRLKEIRLVQEKRPSAPILIDTLPTENFFKNHHIGKSRNHWKYCRNLVLTPAEKVTRIIEFVNNKAQPPVVVETSHLRAGEREPRDIIHLPGFSCCMEQQINFRVLGNDTPQRLEELCEWIESEVNDSSLEWVFLLKYECGHIFKPICRYLYPEILHLQQKYHTL
ncbi:hypothetical protein NQ317_018703 [Molorchus minor]|uniref:Uncharacterized protein n=1 Tax=Molorchus minor TaxID=1323400 RepID=A0ABQ9JRW2_9CUCU|nr:hypothetical protein NQ317_018703 [Molorchus minor]